MKCLATTERTRVPCLDYCDYALQLRELFQRNPEAFTYITLLEDEYVYDFEGDVRL